MKPMNHNPRTTDAFSNLRNLDNLFRAILTCTLFAVGAVYAGPTTIAVEASPNSSTYGTPTTFTAIVKGANPGGTIDFSDAGVPMCPAVVLVAGTANCTISTLNAGIHALAAHYNGDANNDSSSAFISAYQIDPADSAVTLTASPAQTVFGQPVTFTAIMTSASPVGGTVRFSTDLGATLCAAAPVSANGVASCTTTILPVGIETVAALFMINNVADFNHLLNFNTVQYTVNAAGAGATSTTLSTSPVNATYGQPLTLTATVAGTAPIGGTVKFSEGVDQVACDAVPVGIGGTATCIIPLPSAGSHAFRATYAPDASHLGSTFLLTPSYLVSAAPATISLVASPAHATLGQPVTFTATMTSAAPVGGTVKFSTDLGAILCAAAPVSATGVATCTSSTLPADIITIGAVFMANNVADFNHTPNFQSLQYTVALPLATPSSISLVSSPNPVEYGQPVTLTATVTGNNPTGTVSFFAPNIQIESSLLCSAVVLVAHVAKCAVPGDFNNHNPRLYTAVYNGDVNNSASSTFLSLEVTAKTLTAQTITFDVPSPAPQVGMSVSLNATASSGLPVTITSATPTVCGLIGLPTPGGPAMLQILTSGTCIVNANQAGNAVYAAASQLQRTLIINTATGGTAQSITLQSSVNPVAYRQPVLLTALVSGTSPTGTINFSAENDGNVICSAVPIVSGKATCPVAGARNVASVRYLAVYSGDSTNPAGSAEVHQLVIMDVATLTGLTLPRQPSTAAPLVLKAMISARNLGGKITFFENGAALTTCSAIAVSALPVANAAVTPVADVGVASCTIEKPIAGAHTYVANYSHANDSGFEQIALPVTVTPDAMPDYSDMWWAGEAENGWGMSITQHGAIQFIVLYVYDAAGKPVFYVLPNGSWSNDKRSYSGALYQPTSSPFDAYDTSMFKANASVGTATVTYAGGDTAKLTYNINGTSGSKAVKRQSFAADDGQAKLQVNDLWWGGAEQNGWGISIAQQGRMLFPVWYTYTGDGKDTWFVVPGGTWSGPTFMGDIYGTNGSPWLGTTYNPATLVPFKVGTMMLNFTDQSSAIMTYTINGVTQSKAIMRQPF